MQRDPHIAYTTSLPANAFLESTNVQRARLPPPRHPPGEETDGTGAGGCVLEKKPYKGAKYLLYVAYEQVWTNMCVTR